MRRGRDRRVGIVLVIVQGMHILEEQTTTYVFMSRHDVDQSRPRMDVVCGVSWTGGVGWTDNDVSDLVSAPGLSVLDTTAA